MCCLEREEGGDSIQGCLKRANVHVLPEESGRRPVGVGVNISSLMRQTLPAQTSESSSSSSSFLVPLLSTLSHIHESSSTPWAHSHTVTHFSLFLCIVGAVSYHICSVASALTSSCFAFYLPPGNHFSPSSSQSSIPLFCFDSLHIKALRVHLGCLIHPFATYYLCACVCVLFF